MIDVLSFFRLPEGGTTLQLLGKSKQRICSQSVYLMGLGAQLSRSYFFVAYRNLLVNVSAELDARQRGILYGKQR